MRRDTWPFSSPKLITIGILSRCTISDPGRVMERAREHAVNGVGSLHFFFMFQIDIDRVSSLYLPCITCMSVIVSALMGFVLYLLCCS